MEADEDIDNDTLQAKVDASLAYVNDMVSSWMKPSKTPASSRKDVEKEIEQLMRRPPRLGVGAKPPESSDVSGHEALRLKGRLVGKKRGREEEAVNNKAISDDEGESRAGAIKKKPKLDPFDGMGKKKKKQKALAPSEADPSATPIAQEPVVETSAKSVEGLNNPPKQPDDVTRDGLSRVLPTVSSPGDTVLNLNGPPPDPHVSPEQSPKKKRKKRKKKKNRGDDVIQP